MFFNCLDTNNEARDPKIEVSGPRSKNIFNHENENGWISTPMSSQKLIIWGIKDLGEIYFCFIGPEPKNEALNPKSEVSGPKKKKRN